MYNTEIVALITDLGLNMSGADSYKDLLIGFNKKHYRAFTLNNETNLVLPSISSVPGVGASQRKDRYKKIISHEGSNYVKFITKNNQAYSFVWQTNSKHLKTAVRWGIMKPQSITGKVISALGQYRVVAYKRIAKGMISNSHAVKIKLLDLFQDRFEALQDLESMVNKNNTTTDYETKIRSYIAKLQQINATLDDFFEDVLGTSGFDQSTLDHIKNGLMSDIQSATAYLNTVTKGSLLYNNMAKGEQSISEFVKQQMLSGLYELQGVNQDLTYSKQRDFALTRGELNDFIEDARKEIDDHQPDLVNAVTHKHHGLFADNDEELVSYDFSKDELTPDRQREALLAISFIEGWDKLEQTEDKAFVLRNKYGIQKLDVVKATRWQNHRNTSTFFKNLGYFLLNMFISIFVPTRPWEEETWSDDHFHLEATELQKHTPPNEPMWQKPFKLFKQIVYAIFDVFNGVRDFGAKLVIKMPDDIMNDWNSTQALPSLGDTLKEANLELKDISKIEDIRLGTALRECNYEMDSITHLNTSKLAAVEYPLTAGEQNDILTAMARGLNQFGAVFSHNIFAKDPLAGLAFTAAYAVGAGAIYLPAATASVFGAGYVNWFSTIAYSMGSSKFAATIAAGSTQAQVFATGVDGLFHGPSGIAVNVLYQLVEDPLTTVSYFLAAYGLGYVLVNGIAGYQIPWLSEVLKEDLGSAPQTGYPLIGAKVAIMLYEGLMGHKEEEYQEPELSARFQNLAKSLESIDEEQLQDIKRSTLTFWLSKNAEVLLKLKSQQLFDLSRHIEALFSKEQSNSLKKLLYPETHPSIAFQLLSLPLYYIPAILRFCFSLLLTVYAVGSNQEHPFEPVRRAAMNLFEKAKKDLSRLIVFTGFVLYIPYTALSTFAKVFAFIATMTIGRIASFFNEKPGHPLHKLIGSIHAFFRTIGEFIYPVRAIKNVTVAHPTHTIKEIECSYERLMSHMSDSNPQPKQVVASNSNPGTSHGSLWSKTVELDEPNPNPFVYS